MDAATQRRSEYVKLSKLALATKLVEGVRRPDGHIRANCGPVREVMKWQKSEMINDLLDMEFGS